MPASRPTRPRRRVAITGLGIVSPLGCGAEAVWKRLVAGESGAGAITRFDATKFAAQIACQVPDGEDGFNPEEWGISHRDARRMDLFSIYMMAAGEQALQDADWRPETEEEKVVTGISAGSGIGGLTTIQQAVTDLIQKGRTNPFFIPKALINLGAGNLSIRYGLKGPNMSPVTACATGAHAVGDAAEIIARGAAEVMLAGGAEAGVTELGISGFCACKALSTGFNNRPQEASRPWDKDRDGFVMGEGAAVLVLESQEHAEKRGAKIYGEFVGYGASGDAWHMTAPAEDGSGALRAMQAALADAGAEPDEIDYINAHGTSTPLGDEIEIAAIENLFGKDPTHLSVSSTKSSIGHLLGAAGAAESVFALMAMKHNIVPPTLNLDNPSVDTKIDLTPKKARQREIKAVMNNSFGFGGTNASLMFREWA